MEKKKKYIIGIGLITIGIGSAIAGVVHYKLSGKAETSTQVVMTETDAVAVNDKGEYVDSETGRVLTEDEVKDIKGKTNEQTSKKDSGKEDTTEAKNGGNKKEESTTEKPKKETTTEAPKKDNGGKKEEGTTQKPKQESTTEKPKENNTEAPKKETTTEAKTETKTEAKKEEACSHDWVWKTHTVHHDAVTHTENHYGEAWDEAVYVQKVRCAVCGGIYDSTPDYHARDNCMGGYGHVDVVDHYIHHEPELLWSEEIVDKEAYDEEVKDYQYCSKCGQKK